jgi:hypothetical protein
VRVRDEYYTRGVICQDGGGANATNTENRCCEWKPSCRLLWPHRAWLMRGEWVTITLYWCVLLNYAWLSPGMTAFFSILRKIHTMIQMHAI